MSWLLSTKADRGIRIGTLGACNDERVRKVPILEPMAQRPGTQVGHVALPTLELECLKTRLEHARLPAAGMTLPRSILARTPRTTTRRTSGHGRARAGHPMEINTRNPDAPAGPGGNVLTCASTSP